MKHKLKLLTLFIVAITTIVITLLHGTDINISIFHNMVLHPIFLLSALTVLAITLKQHKQ